MNAPRAGLPDRGTSRAVLVGVSDYETLEGLPSVESNVGVVKGLSEAGLEHYADALLGETAASARRVHDIAAYLASLCDAGQSRAVRVLLRRALAGAGRKEVTELVAALRAQGHDPAIAAVAAWVRATTDGGEADVKYRLLRVGLKDFVVDRRHRW
ncbi:hypothetical protein [Actinophytocola sp.]|uniref:hypothetical protein n=1 Tax=Actinophytocola sp. TaxID=1872138 RepID=UPI002D51EFF8|nr:hypothetical protein [Actinophytocola sp.]HYQ68694.1 hypothetical protein [Actinophytocola sp.]